MVTYFLIGNGKIRLDVETEENKDNESEFQGEKGRETGTTHVQKESNGKSFDLSGDPQSAVCVIL